MTIRVKGGEEEDGGGAGRSGRERREKRGEKELKEERKSDKQWKGRETLPYGWGGGRKCTL